MNNEPPSPPSPPQSPPQSPPEQPGPSAVPTVSEPNTSTIDPLLPFSPQPQFLNQMRSDPKTSSSDPNQLLFPSDPQIQDPIFPGQNEPPIKQPSVVPTEMEKMKQTPPPIPPRPTAPHNNEPQLSTPSPPSAPPPSPPQSPPEQPGPSAVTTVSESNISTIDSFLQFSSQPQFLYQMRSDPKASSSDSDPLLFPSEPQPPQTQGLIFPGQNEAQIAQPSVVPTENFSTINFTINNEPPSPPPPPEQPGPSAVPTVSETNISTIDSFPLSPPQPQFLYQMRSDPKTSSSDPDQLLFPSEPQPSQIQDPIFPGQNEPPIEQPFGVPTEMEEMKQTPPPIPPRPTAPPKEQLSSNYPPSILRQHQSPAPSQHRAHFGEAKELIHSHSKDPHQYIDLIKQLTKDAAHRPERPQKYTMPEDAKVPKQPKEHHHIQTNNEIYFEDDVILDRDPSGVFDCPCRCEEWKCFYLCVVILIPTGVLVFYVFLMIIWRVVEDIIEEE